MPRVEWSRRTADEVESVIAIMLCLENPSATRVRPSQGDGGIDVYVPHDGRWTVFQVKSFTGSLDTSRKRQIRKSWSSLLRHVKAEGRDIAEWFLVRPEDPTIQDQNWLDDLVTGAEFPCAWRGLSFCDALAASYPEVIDYYFLDGKERLQQALSDLLAVVSGPNARDATTPAGNIERLTALHSAVNAHDPHYRYDFSVRSAQAVGALPLAEPGMLAAVVRSDGHTEVTFRIFARYDEATSDRPVPGWFVLEAQTGTPEHQALMDFVEYGLPAKQLAVRELGIDLPGGLGGTHEAGLVSIGPTQASSARPLRLQLVVLSESDDVVGIADLDMDPATAGLDGTKFALTGIESAGVFRITLKFRPEEKQVTFSVTAQELDGMEPADVLPGLRVLEALRPPNRLLLKLRNGPRLHEAIAVPTAITEGAGQSIRVCEALATIQEHTTTPVRIPDFTETSVDEASEWIRAAKLLQGETLRITWTRVRVELHEGAFLPATTEGAFTVATAQPLVVAIASTEIHLGQEVVQLAAARVDPCDLVDGRPAARSVHLIPSGDDTGTIHLVKQSQSVLEG